MRVSLLPFVLFLATSFIGAQMIAAQTRATPDQEGNSDRSNPKGSQKTVSGCLSHINGEYMLTSKNGMIYKLTHDVSKLAAYAGQEVRVTGMVIAKSGTDGTHEADGTGGTLETLRVNSLKHISNTCPSGEGEMPK